MRKEVKLGVAIGGVLLAVLIVYVLVVSGGSDKKQVAQGGSGATEGAGSVSLEPVEGDPATAPPVPPPAPAAQYDPAGGSTDPFAPTAKNAGSSDAQASATSPRKDDWNKILNEQLVLMTETPQVVGGARGSASPAVAEAPAPSPAAVEAPAPQTPAPEPQAEPAPITAAPTTPVVSAPPAEPIAAPAGNPTVQPSDASTASAAPMTVVPSPAGREHVVQLGETLSSISAAVYGNPNYYPHILRANPTLNPNRIRPGTKIVLPDASTVRPASSEAGAAASSSGAAPLDASRQYRVQPGDSLHKIALRLYGDSAKSEALYQLNKQMIGADPHRLKVGQVLALPEAPTAR